MKRDSLDALFSNYIRLRAGYKCQRCGKQYPERYRGFHACHIFGRGKLSVRWNLDNAFAADYGCHRYLDLRPLEKLEFAKELLGEERFEALKQEAAKPGKPDRQAIQEELRRKIIALGGKARLPKECIEFVCKNCNRKDKFDKSQLSHYPTSGRFCSLACKKDYYLANPSDHPCYRENKKIDISGYRLTRVRRNGKSKIIREHRIVMESILGRPLHSWEVVHHKDGNKENNDPSNLELMTKSEHHKLHGSSVEMKEVFRKAQRLAVLSRKRRKLCQPT